MLKRTLWIRDQNARYMRSFLGLCLLQKSTFNCVHSVQSDLELCLLQKPIYMYVQAYDIDSGSERTIYAVFPWSMSSANLGKNSCIKQANFHLYQDNKWCRTTARLLTGRSIKRSSI